jgi:hypothetical protein
MCAAAARGAHSDWAYNKVSSVLCCRQKLGCFQLLLPAKYTLFFMGPPKISLIFYTYFSATECHQNFDRKTLFSTVFSC